MLAPDQVGTLNSVQELRAAFYGRTSDKDAQDPSLSIPRQHTAAQKVTGTLNARIIRHYYDIESGKKALDERGQGEDAAALGIALRRDGGLPELLRDARANTFDVVVVESIDRVSRRTFTSTQIEEELKELDIQIFAADEPIGTLGTMLLTRRLKQGIAEWYITDLLDKSRRGMEASVEQGWHTGGRAPYGYLLEEHPHPNPSKAREGRKKHRLIVDPVRAPVVEQIFRWYCSDGLGLGELVDRLNRDLERYPAPEPNKKDACELRPSWSRSSVRAILRNPKYTGFNVWNRHDKRKGKKTLRPQNEWTWSREETHPALVEKELFDLVPISAERNTNRIADGRAKRYTGEQRKHGRVYPTAGHVFCALCHCRLEGSYQREKHWMRCQFVQRRGEAAAEATGHPKSLQVKEQLLIDALADFLNRRVFGPDRLNTLRDEICGAASNDGNTQEAALDELRGKLATVEQSLYRQSLRLEEHDDPNHPVVAAAKRRIEELGRERAKLGSEIERLDVPSPEQPEPEALEADLLAIPDLSDAIFASSPSELAEIYDAFEVVAYYDKRDNSLEITATVVPELWDDPENEPPAQRAGRRTSSIAGAGFEPATSGL